MSGRPGIKRTCAQSRERSSDDQSFDIRIEHWRTGVRLKKGGSYFAAGRTELSIFQLSLHFH